MSPGGVTAPRLTSLKMSQKQKSLQVRKFIILMQFKDYVPFQRVFKNIIKYYRQTYEGEQLNVP
jgi:hypothetical protein